MRRRASFPSAAKHSAIGRRRRSAKNPALSARGGGFAEDARALLPTSAQSQPKRIFHQAEPYLLSQLLTFS